MRGNIFKRIILFSTIAVLSSVFLLYWENHFNATNIIQKNKTFFSTVLKNPAKYEIQVIYSKLVKLPWGQTIFFTSSYGKDSSKYFYPASSIKLPVAALALEKLATLNKGKISINAKLRFEEDKSLGLPKFERSFKDIIQNCISRSDNLSYNYLYEFLGQNYINTTLHKKAYDNSLILTRLGLSMPIDHHKKTRGFSIYENNQLQYSEDPPRKNTTYNLNSMNLTGLIKGEKTKFNFENLNYFSIEDLHTALKSVVFPNKVSRTKRFVLREVDRVFLLDCLGKDSPEFKFFICGSENSPTQGTKIYNKIGQAYGYVIDNAYIINIKDNVEFFLSAVIYVNENNVVGDGEYEYESLALPFMRDLGNVFYEASKRN